MMQIAEAIKTLRQNYIHDGKAPSYFQINNGLCENFAMEVVERLGGETGGLFLVCGENFMIGEDGDEFENDLWAWELLHTHWGISSPEGMSCSEMDKLDIGGHVWITDGKRHYDAECPEGVDSFFDLPLFRRSVVQALREKGIPAEEVCVFDVEPAPVCPVPNPVLCS